MSAAREAVEKGKVAIILEILEAERNSSLRYSPQTGRFNVDDIDGGWIQEVLSMAVAGLRRNELQSSFDQITFINFNYDRAIEQFLCWSLQQRMRASALFASLRGGYLSFTRLSPAHLSPCSELPVLRRLKELPSRFGPRYQLR